MSTLKIIAIAAAIFGAMQVLSGDYWLGAAFLAGGIFAFLAPSKPLSPEEKQYYYDQAQQRANGQPTRTYYAGTADQPYQRQPTERERAAQRKAENREQGIACCPKCGSTSLTANKKGYGIGKGVLGAMATANPLGLAAGNIGRQKVKVTCLNCGHQFKPGARR